MYSTGEITVKNDKHSHVSWTFHGKSLGINYVPGTLSKIQHENQTKQDHGFSTDRLIFLGKKELKHESTMNQQCSLAK